ncbi:MAG: hypothetical protein AB7K37_09485 [Cyclobacteriaceae bacterium]
MKNILRLAPIVLLLLFAMGTLFMSGSVLFDLFGIREKEGNFVLFIVVTNFVCGFLYLAAVWGWFFKKMWTTRALALITGILLVSFIALIGHILAGGIYELQTVKAMLFRMVATGVFTFLSWRLIRSTNDQHEFKKTIH